MEKLMNKAKILLWVAIGLTLFNIAIIVTLFWQFKRDKTDFGHEKREMPISPSPMIGNMMKGRLQLSKEQAVKFDSIDNKFKSKSIAIFGKMKGLRGEMIKEITSENPDSSKLIKLTKDLGDLHINLKMNTFEFYFSMKKVCRPEQQKELSNIFRGMFLFDGMSGSGRLPHKFNQSGPSHREGEGYKEFGPGKKEPGAETGECKDKHHPDSMKGGQKPDHEKPHKKDLSKEK